MAGTERRDCRSTEGLRELQGLSAMARVHRLHTTATATAARMQTTPDPVDGGRERLFIGEIKAGRDPSRPPTRSIQVSTELRNVAAFLDAYLERCVKPAGLRSINSIRSRILVLKTNRAIFTDIL